MRTIAAAMACLMAACAPGGGPATNVNQNYGRIVVSLDPDPQRLTLTIFNARDIGYDYDDAADRAALVAGLLANQCGAPAIEATRVTLTGTPLLRQGKVYTLKVRCPNGASKPAE